MMCCEDVAIDNAKFAEGESVALVAGNQELLSPSPTRIAIVFGQPTSGTVRVAVGSDQGSVAGLTLSANVDPIMLDIRTHGNIVRKGWNAWASVGTSMYIIETHLSPANPCNGSQ